jgi:bifunctional non-homologous end joining protein LigD
MADRLTEYRRKRDAKRTPEPVPEQPAEAPDQVGSAAGRGDAFVIQQHHARRLHWDLRLERDGVLVSWAVPRGLPRDPARNHLAVHTEDHPMEYLDFHGEIPAGEYGGGRMTIYDRGTYTTEKWRDREVIVVLRGERVSGRYVLFQTHGKDWMVHRMDPPPAGWTPVPELVLPMQPTRAAKLPEDDDAWGYELGWPGTRAIAEVSGGRLRLMEGEKEITDGYPQVRAMAEALAPTECLLDGVIVGFDAAGRVGAPRPADGHYLLVDLLWLDGVTTTELPYARRRELLAELGIAGPRWQTPPHFTGGGADVRVAARDQGAPAVLAKRLDSPYLPGRRTRRWLRIPA